MNLLFGFLSGMFLTNGLPHFVSGIMGKSHMTPLGKESSAVINIVWGFINFLGGMWLFNVTGATFRQVFSFDMLSISFLAGVLFMAIADGKLFSNPNAAFPWFKK